MKILFKTVHGSYFYGTNVPSSDKDFKVIYLPSKRDLFLGKSLKNKVDQSSEFKHTENDTDTEYISVHTFVSDFVSGQTYALELAFAPTLEQDGEPEFVQLVQQLRTQCLTKDVSAMVGYCRTQAKVYSEKGKRLSTLEQILELAKQYKPYKHLMEYKGFLPSLPYTDFGITTDNREYYEVCGSKHLLDIKCEEFVKRIQGDIESYGKRAQRAKESGTDHKAMMHACRVAMEAKDLRMDHLADDLLHVDRRFGSDFAGDHDQAGRDHCLARHAAVRVLGEQGVEDAVGNLVGQLVGMAHADRFAGE